MHACVQTLRGREQREEWYLMKTHTHVSNVVLVWAAWPVFADLQKNGCVIELGNSVLLMSNYALNLLSPKCDYCSTVSLSHWVPLTLITANYLLTALLHVIAPPHAREVIHFAARVHPGASGAQTIHKCACTHTRTLQYTHIFMDICSCMCTRYKVLRRVLEMF